jgi:hypothetical protein
MSYIKQQEERLIELATYCAGTEGNTRGGT